MGERTTCLFLPYKDKIPLTWKKNPSWNQSKTLFRILKNLIQMIFLQENCKITLHFGEIQISQQ
jgi:hypothetical protein